MNQYYKDKQNDMASNAIVVVVCIVGALAVCLISWLLN